VCSSVARARTSTGERIEAGAREVPARVLEGGCRMPNFPHPQADTSKTC
jgi:hypothetical protein